MIAFEIIWERRTLFMSTVRSGKIWKRGGIRGNERKSWWLWLILSETLRESWGLQPSTVLTREGKSCPWRWEDGYDKKVEMQVHIQEIHHFWIARKGVSSFHSWFLISLLCKWLPSPASFGIFLGGSLAPWKSWTSTICRLKEFGWDCLGKR